MSPRSVIFLLQRDVGCVNFLLLTVSVQKKEKLKCELLRHIKPLILKEPLVGAIPLPSPTIQNSLGVSVENTMKTQ